MKSFKSLLLLSSFLIVTIVQSQQDNHKFNYFQIKKDGDESACRTHEEGDYSLVVGDICHYGCGGYIKIAPTPNYNEYKFTMTQDTKCNDNSNPTLFICNDPSIDWIKIGSTGYSAFCNTNNNVSTPTPSVTSSTSSSHEMPSNSSSSETTTPTPSTSNTVTPTPTQSNSSTTPTPSVSNNPSETPSQTESSTNETPNGNDSSILSYSITLLLISSIFSLL